MAWVEEVRSYRSNQQSSSYALGLVRTALAARIWDARTQEGPCRIGGAICVPIPTKCPISTACPARTSLPCVGAFSGIDAPEEHQYTAKSATPEGEELSEIQGQEAPLYAARSGVLPYLAGSSREARRHISALNGRAGGTGQMRLAPYL